MSVRGRLLAGAAAIALSIGAALAAPADPAALLDRAFALAQAGKEAEAAELLAGAIAAPDPGGAVSDRAMLHGVLADLKSRLGAPDEAIAIAEKGLALLAAEREPDPTVVAMLSISRAYAVAAARPGQEALAAFRDAVAAADRAPGDPMEWDYLRDRLATDLADAGLTDEAVTLRLRMRSLAAATGTPDQQLSASRAYAALLDSTDRFAEAADAYGGHLALLDRLGLGAPVDRAAANGRRCLAELGAARPDAAAAIALAALGPLNSEPASLAGARKFMRLCLAYGTDRAGQGDKALAFDAAIWRVLAEVAEQEDKGDAQGAAAMLIGAANRLMAERGEDDPGLAPLFQFTGAFAIEAGQAPAANGWLVRAGALASADDRYSPAFFSLVVAGWMEVDLARGRMRDAIAFYDSAERAIANAGPDPDALRAALVPELALRKAALDEAVAIYEAGVSAYRAGVAEPDLRRQAELFSEAVAHFRKLAAADDFAVISMGLAAETHKRLGRMDDAIAYAREARSRIDRWQSAYIEDERVGGFAGFPFELLARLYMDLGDAAAARTITERGIAFTKGDGDLSRYLRASLHAMLVQQDIDAGRLEPAREHLAEAFKAADGLADFRDILDPRLRLAEARLARAEGRAEEASRLYSALLDLYDNQPYAEVNIFAEAARDLAAIEAMSGEARAVARRLEKRLEALWNFGSHAARAEIVAGYVLMSAIYHRAGLEDMRLKAARQAAKHAVNRIEEAQRLNRVSTASAARTKSFRDAFEALVAAGWNETRR